jgi:hypothetical protein
VPQVDQVPARDEEEDATGVHQRESSSSNREGTRHHSVPDTMGLFRINNQSMVGGRGRYFS